MYIYIYIYILFLLFIDCGPDGFGRELDVGGQAKICARELASVASRYL